MHVREKTKQGSLEEMKMLFYRNTCDLILKLEVTDGVGMQSKSNGSNLQYNNLESILGEALYRCIHGDKNILLSILSIILSPGQYFLFLF